MQDYLHRSIDLDDPAIADTFDELSFWSSHFGRLMVAHVPLKHHQQVLDVGCGNGFPLFELAHMMGPTAHLTGLDPWEPALARAQHKKATYDSKNIELILGDGADMPFDASQFDLIVSNVGINNFDEPEKVLAECHRVLKPEGQICMTSNVAGHMEEFYEVFADALKELGFHDFLPALERQIAHRGSVEGIILRLEASGFEVTQVVEDHFVMRFLDGSALLRHWLVVVGFLDGWRSVIGKKNETAVFARIEEKLNQLAEHQGELKMTVPMVFVKGKKV